MTSGFEGYGIMDDNIIKIVPKSKKKSKTNFVPEMLIQHVDLNTQNSRVQF